MLYVDDQHFDLAYFERCAAVLAKHPVFGACEGKRITACLQDTAFAIAVCLYVKSHGGSLFPLAVDTPLEAARRRAERSGSHFLLFGDGEAALGTMEAVTATANAAVSSTPGLVQMSSGTTGEPKYIERSWGSIADEVESYVAHFPAANRMTPVVACPVNHSYGLICGVFVALRRGVEPVVVKNLNPKYILRKLREAEAPLLYSSPTLIHTLCMLVSEDQPLFAVMTSGTLMQRSWFDGVRKKVRHLHQQYGCSEAGCITLGEDIEAANELGAPLPHLRLVTRQDAAAPDEIRVTLSDGRVIETRDLGYLEGGKAHFVSRVDDMINVSGLNVYPSEVEEVVLALPGVSDAVAFKRAHVFGNDQVCVWFAAEQPIPHQRVREWCGRQLARHQVPMSITQVPSIPRLPNGKVSRKAIAQAAETADAAERQSREALS